MDGRRLRTAARVPRRGASTRRSTAPTATAATSRWWSCCATWRRNGFTTYIASGGDRDFMRPVARRSTAFRPSGSSGAYALRYDDDETAARRLQRRARRLRRRPEKPVRIWSRIGRRPILAVGNSNGDIPMLHFAGGHGRPALRVLVLHDDAEREGSQPGDALAGGLRGLGDGLELQVRARRCPRHGASWSGGGVSCPQGYPDLREPCASVCHGEKWCIAPRPPGAPVRACSWASCSSCRHRGRESARRRARSGRAARPDPAGWLGDGEPFADPFAYDPDREREFVRRAAAGTSHVLYVRSPGGAPATRRARRPLAAAGRAAARQAGVRPGLARGPRLPRERRAPRRRTPGGLEGAVGLTQILAETGQHLLGMHVDVAAQPARLTQRIARAERRGRADRVARLEARRARSTSASTPPRRWPAPRATSRSPASSFGREDLALAAYHMGVGNLEGVLRATPASEPPIARARHRTS